MTRYITEAHPQDEWLTGVNEAAGICYPQPTVLAERLVIARDFIQQFDYQLPLVVDSMENQAMDLFAAWPERLYIIDAEGLIAYKGGIDPMFFDLDGVESWLEDNLGSDAGGEKAR